MRTTRTRLAVILFAALALTTSLSVFTYDHAHAAGSCAGVSNLTYCVSFSPSWTFKSPSPSKGGVSRCVVYKVSGHIGYNTVLVSPKQNLGKWTNITLINPVLTASVTSYNGSTCGSAANLNAITLEQSWSGYACSFNPSISFGAPWSVGVSFWPSCGNRNLADHNYSNNSTSSHYSQGNTGSNSHFGDFTGDALNSKPCYGVFVDSSITVGSNGDNFTSSAKEVCLPWQHSA